ncbi:hypothetical protein TNCV_2836461 [Trichonephila clavipes]|nr:hypothetical protein TNCV_2836461 [Trichonephila clavipes]
MRLVLDTWLGSRKRGLEENGLIGRLEGESPFLSLIGFWKLVVNLGDFCFEESGRRASLPIGCWEVRIMARKMAAQVGCESVSGVVTNVQ